MPLDPRHLPLPRPVRDQVRERFAPDSEPRGQTLEMDEIISYLSRSMDTDSSPLATIRRRAAKAGRS